MLFIANLISQFIQQHVVASRTEGTPTMVLRGVGTLPNELLTILIIHFFKMDDSMVRKLG